MNSKAEDFRQALKAGQALFGLNCAIPSAHTVELLGPSGYDFLVLDAEHPPTGPATIHTQLMALAGTDTAAFVKLPALDPVAVRQYLDLGADGLMAPDIETAEDAAQLVRMTRYPPNGTRGIGAAVRATRFTRDKSYMTSAESRFCRVGLIESRKALDNLESIAAVQGLDILFFGPSDIAAQLGYFGQVAHPDVRSALETAIGRVLKAGKVAGIACGEADVAHYRSLGTSMFVVGSEMTLFAQAADGLAGRLREKYRAGTS